MGVAPQAQGSVAGAWDLTINGPQGAITATATLKQEGDNVTGADRHPSGHGRSEGHVQGQDADAGFSIAGPDGPLEIKVNGEVDGDTVKGMLDFGMGQADFTGEEEVGRAYFDS